MRKTLFYLLLLLPFAGSAAIAEEPGDEIAEDAQPAAEIAERTTPDGGEGIAAEIAAIEPAVPTTILAPDVRRRENAGGVMDEIELSRSEITGNQELPKVLYIVPWQKSDPGDLTGKPVNTLLDEVLAPIDRSEFMRQVSYYEDLYGEDQE